MTTNDIPGVLTVEEAAKVLRISRGLAYTAVRTGQIAHIRLGKRILIPAEVIRQMVGALGTAPTPSAQT